MAKKYIDAERYINNLRELRTGDKDTVYEYYDDGIDVAISEAATFPAVDTPRWIKPNSKELSETHKALDIISRQAAIDAIEQHKKAVLEGREWDEGIAYGYAAAHGHLVEIVKQLPSAERRGRWKGERLIYPSGIITFIYRCSECGYEERHAYEDTKPSKYCPNCGARMEASE